MDINWLHNFTYYFDAFILVLNYFVSAAAWALLFLLTQKKKAKKGCTLQTHTFKIQFMICILKDNRVLEF